MLRITANPIENQVFASSLDEIAREGARRLLIEALGLEVDAYIDHHKGLRDDKGRALVVRNGKAEPRSVTIGSGTIEVKAPRVNDRREGHAFTSAILPPYMRRSPNVESLLPVLYLKGLSTNDFREALVGILGSGASGLSSSSISALKKSWEGEFDAWQKRDIAQQYVWMWVYWANILGPLPTYQTLPQQNGSQVPALALPKTGAIHFFFDDVKQL